MIKIMSIEESDRKILDYILNIHYELVGSFDGKFFKYLVDDKIKYLYREGDLFVVYYLDNEYIYYQMFNIDNDYNITSFEYNDYIVDVDKQDYMFVNQKKNVTSLVKVDKRPNGEDIDGYNGAIIYSQYNSRSDVSSAIVYQYMYSDMRDKCRIYDYHMKNPMEIIIAETPSFKSPSTYVIRKAQKGTLEYELMVRKDKHNVDLFYGNTIERYYNMIFNYKDYAVTGFPFAKQYTPDDMKKYLENVGLDYIIPHDIRHFYNYGENELLEYQQLALKMKEVEKEIDKVSPIKLTFKRGDS